MEKECFNLIYLKDKYVTTTDTIDFILKEFQDSSNSMTCAINRRNFTDAQNKLSKVQELIEDMKQAIDLKETG